MHCSFISKLDEKDPYDLGAAFEVSQLKSLALLSIRFYELAFSIWPGGTNVR